MYPLFLSYNSQKIQNFGFLNRLFYPGQYFAATFKTLSYQKSLERGKSSTLEGGVEKLQENQTVINNTKLQSTNIVQDKLYSLQEQLLKFNN